MGVASHCLLIEPYCKHNERVFIFRKVTVNGKPFTFYLRVSNLGKADFPGGKLEDVSIYSRTGSYIKTIGSVDVPPLKPHETKDVLIDDSLVLYNAGLHWVQCKPLANDGLTIQTKQKLLGGKLGRGEPSNLPGYWRGPLMIDDIYLVHQRRINYWLLILTALTALTSILVVFEIVRNILL